MRRIDNIFLILLLAIALLPIPGVAAEDALYTISAMDVEKAVATELQEKGAGDSVKAMLTSNKQQAVYGSDKPLTIDIKTLQFDKTAARWTANLVFLSGADVVSALPISGRYQETAQMPVLKRPVNAGEKIAATDIDYVDLPLSRTRSDIITDANLLIGQSPKRSISANRPIRQNEISAPLMVKKNSVIQISYNTPTMHLSTSGQAMDAGAKGDVITVRNLNSKQIVRAVVENENTVSVLPMVQSTALEAPNHVN